MDDELNKRLQKQINKVKMASIIKIIIFLFLIAGEIQCIYKAIKCNWEPIGKAEIIYTAGSFTGLGCIIGWMDIKDK